MLRVQNPMMGRRSTLTILWLLFSPRRLPPTVSSRQVSLRNTQIGFVLFFFCFCFSYVFVVLGLLRCKSKVSSCVVVLCQVDSDSSPLVPFQSLGGFGWWIRRGQAPMRSCFSGKWGEWIFSGKSWGGVWMVGKWEEKEREKKKVAEWARKVGWFVSIKTETLEWNNNGKRRTLGKVRDTQRFRERERERNEVAYFWREIKFWELVKGSRVFGGANWMR